MIMEISIIRDPNGWYSASIPDLQAHTQWENWEELMKNISECITLSIKCMQSESDQKNASAHFTILKKSPRFYLNMEHLFDASYV